MRNMLHRSNKIRLLIATFFFIPLCLFAQPKIKKTRILFLLDASSSMTYPWSGSNARFDIASNILLRIMDSVYSINNEIEFAVRAYGTQYPAQLNNCIDTKLEVPFNLQNTNQIKTRLYNLKPIGSSPIAYSLKEASEHELNDAALYDYSVIFITDGGESCNGDVCGVFLQLLQKKITIKPYVIGLDKNENLKNYYACLGNYIEVSEPADIEKAVNLIVDANRSIIEKPKQLKLVTTYSNVPTIVDSVTTMIVPKKDTGVPPTIIVENKEPELPRINLNMPFLKRMKLAKRVDEKGVIMIYSTFIQRSKEVKIVLNLSEPKKTAPNFETIYSVTAPYKMKPGKANLVAKKSNLKSPKKVSLRFEYEEPRKLTKDMVSLEPMFAKINLAAKKGTLVAKKSNLKNTKKASLRFEYEEEKKQTPVVALLNPIYAKIKLVASKTNLIAKKSNLKKASSVKLKFEYEVPPKINLASLKIINYPKRYSYANKLPDTRGMVSSMNKMKSKKAVLRFTYEEKKGAAKKDTIIPPPTMLNNSIEFTTEVVASKETMVQLYFKGTNGKTYPTARPMIMMQDVKTNATVTSFYREMNGNEPVPQKVKEGLYNLVIKGFDDLYANNIVIKPNTTTKVVVKVNDGTLKFAYQGNIKRPMTEYTAIVNRRFAAGATVKQKCSETRTYEPGTYYLEIDCLPPSKHSIDLTFDATFEIQIPEPGTLAIMNEKPMGKIQIQTMLGDQFVTFYTMNITGKQNDQRLQLLSGYPLRIVYPADPANPAAGNKEVPFRINANNILELELK